MHAHQEKSPATDIVDRLWRAYIPYRRGRSTEHDLDAMFAILVLARFARSAKTFGPEFGRRWTRAVTEAGLGYSPLSDLRGAARLATQHEQLGPRLSPHLDAAFPDGERVADELPWAAAFLTALQESTGKETDQAGLGEVSGLLLERYSGESDSQRGEFYTPRQLTDLAAEALSVQPGGRVLDPACGTGGFLVAAARYVAENHGRGDDASLKGYTMDHRNPGLAALNLAVHGIEEFSVRASAPESLFRDPGGDPADYVMLNPPFNQRVTNLADLRWPFGAPPESNANFAWLQFAWSRLNGKGRAAVIMPTGAASARGTEAEIRRNMLLRGAILAVVALPEGLFLHTGIPVHIWLLAGDPTGHVPARDNSSVLFIDASRLGKRSRRRRILRDEDVRRIAERFQKWSRSPHTTPDEPEFSQSVSWGEILEGGDCSLDPRLYVARERTASARDTHGLLDALLEQAESASRSTTLLRGSFERSERAALSETGAQQVRLGELVGTASGTSAASHAGVLLAGPSGSLVRAEHYVEETDGVPVVMPKNLKGNSFSTTDIRRISERQARELRRFRLQSGDVVVARRGELGRAAVVRAEQEGWMCGTGCFLLRPPAALLDADYFVAYLRSPEARLWLENHSTGSMRMRTIPRRALTELPMALPGLATQRSIADTMAQLDARERALRDQLELTQHIRQAALDGDIIPQS